jgi:hypothetical protein
VLPAPIFPSQLQSVISQIDRGQPDSTQEFVVVFSVWFDLELSPPSVLHAMTAGFIFKSDATNERVVGVVE